MRLSEQREKVQVVSTAASEDLIQKAVGGCLRAAGGVDGPGLRAFLDRRATTMPRTMLRYAIEHFEPEEKAHYMGPREPANGRSTRRS